MIVGLWLLQGDDETHEAWVHEDGMVHNVDM